MTEEVDDLRQQVADAFDRDNDPLEQYSATFSAVDVDPFSVYFDDVVTGMGLAERTLEDYRRIFDQWKDHMADSSRHPACPNESYVKSFALHYLDKRDNRPDTVKKKLNRLSRAYTYWQQDPSFPHPVDYNPFALVKQKLDLRKPHVKDPPKISIQRLREILSDVTHIRDLPIIFFGLKLGLRAGEICNIELQDVTFRNTEIEGFYPNFGTHPMVQNRSNAVYIPPEPNSALPVQGRRGNKSSRPRVLPLDDEMQKLLRQYLLIRPDTTSSKVFLSKQHHQELENAAVNNVWKSVFHPEYTDLDRYRSITSHFGRHRFTTYWRVEEDLNRALIKYMRGDIVPNTSLGSTAAIDEYIHSYYEDIERPYRDRIFKLLF